VLATLQAADLHALAAQMAVRLGDQHYAQMVDALSKDPVNRVCTHAWRTMLRESRLGAYLA
jgi:hypothetical protein